MNYMRFGEIPENEKSINWFKVKLDDQRDFSWSLEIGETIEEAYRMIRNIDEVFEAGVSVFELSENNKPILSNDKLQNDYNYRLEHNEKCYIVTGDEVGRGCDGEPLIRNIKIIKEL